MSFQDGSLTVNVDFSTWTFWGSVLRFVIFSAIYGYITHLHSLFGLKRHNAEVMKKFGCLCPTHEITPIRTTTGRKLSASEKGLEGLGFSFLLFYRLFLNLPVRIVALILGFIFVGLEFLATFRIASNVVFSWGWHWHMTASQIAGAANGLGE